MERRQAKRRDRRLWRRRGEDCDRKRERDKKRTLKSIKFERG